MPRKTKKDYSTQMPVGKMVMNILYEAKIKGNTPNIFYLILALNYLVHTLNVNSYKQNSAVFYSVNNFLLQIKKVKPIIKFIVYKEDDSIFIKYYNESTKLYKRIGNSSITKNFINKIYNNPNFNDDHYFLDFYRSLTENLKIFTYNSKKVNDSFFEYYVINQNLKDRFNFEIDELNREIISFTDRKTGQKKLFEDFNNNLIARNLKKYQKYTKDYYGLNEQFELLNKAQGELNIYTNKHQELNAKYQKLNEDYRGFANEYRNILGKNLDDESPFIKYLNTPDYYLRFFNRYQLLNDVYSILNAKYDNLITRLEEEKHKKNTEIVNEAKSTTPKTLLDLDFNPEELEVPLNEIF